MTRRLFWEDAYAREFTAKVARRTARGVVLDRTLFFPTSGGQPNDTGTLNDIRVADVVEDGEEIVHVLEGASLDSARDKLAAGADVKGAIDWDRRLDHMQQHDGQHILSEAFIRVCGAETASFHLGRDVCAIDLDKTGVTDRHIDDAQKLANRVVWENRPIAIGFFTRDEAAKLPVRKPPPFAVAAATKAAEKAAGGEPQAEGRIRIVHVQDFDCSACCGTHAKTSGETGMVLVVGAEYTKAGCRVHFVCGWRALEWARKDVSLLETAGARLSSGRADVVVAIERMKAESAENHKALQAAEKQLAEVRGRELAAAAAPRGKARFVVEVFEKRDIKYLQMVANQVVSGAGLVAVLGGTGATSSVVLARSKDVEIDLRPIGKDAFAAIGGKGGGPPHFVQGGGAGQNLREAMKIAEDRIAAALG